MGDSLPGKTLKGGNILMYRKFIKDIDASIHPVILFLLTIFVCGLLYNLLFLKLFQPIMESWIPASDYKIYQMMLIYAMPMTIMITGIISVFKSALKKAVRGG